MKTLRRILVTVILSCLLGSCVNVEAEAVEPSIGLDMFIIEEPEQGNIFEDTRLNLMLLAEDEVGTVTGRKYNSYYGYSPYIPWCAVFVSWCADQMGLVDAGIMPRFAGVPSGYRWFKTRGLYYRKNEITPEPGMVIFYDICLAQVDEEGKLYWVNGHDGVMDHVGYVKCVEDGYLTSIEGNYTDKVVERYLPLDSRDILGYGAPRYN